MLTILSPAKKLSNECFARTQNYTTPTFLNESQALVEILRSKKRAETFTATMEAAAWKVAGE